MNESITTYQHELTLSFLGGLIANALKFTPEEGEVSVCIQKKEGFFQIRVIDMGIGSTFYIELPISNKAEKVLAQPRSELAYDIVAHHAQALTLEKSTQLRKTLQQKYAGNNITFLPTLEADDIESQFLQKLRKIIMDNLADENFRVEPHLCRAIGMSRPQLYRKLKAAINQSPSIFMQSIRMEEARKLLLNTDLSIAEISDQVGFKEPSYFSKIYQKVFKETPSETRKVFIVN